MSGSRCPGEADLVARALKPLNLILEPQVRAHIEAGSVAATLEQALGAGPGALMRAAEAFAHPRWTRSWRSCPFRYSPSTTAGSPVGVLQAIVPGTAIRAQRCAEVYLGSGYRLLFGKVPSDADLHGYYQRAGYTVLAPSQPLRLVELHGRTATIAAARDQQLFFQPSAQLEPAATTQPQAIGKPGSSSTAKSCGPMSAPRGWC